MQGEAPVRSTGDVAGANWYRFLHIASSFLVSRGTRLDHAISPKAVTGPLLKGWIANENQTIQKFGLKFSSMVIESS
jgi:hypothetical protein